MNLAKPTLVAAVLFLSACEKPDVESSAGGTLDNDLVQSTDIYMQFKVPKRFEMDPSSHQGEAKWWCRFDDPDTGLSVEASSYGYIGDLELLMTVPGWTFENYPDKLDRDGRDVEEIIKTDATHKNIESYFLSEVLPERCQKTQFPFYDRYIHHGHDKLTAFFFDRSSAGEIFGQCYEEMTFTCDDGNLERHEELVMNIVDSARPWLSRYQSEQAGTGKPAPLPESKPEGSDKPQPESEGGSR